MVNVTGVRQAAFLMRRGWVRKRWHMVSKTKADPEGGRDVGPVIDTLIMCTLTALVLMVTGVWDSGIGDGVLLTTQAFEEALPSWSLSVTRRCAMPDFLRCSDFPIMW